MTTLGGQELGGRSLPRAEAPKLVSGAGCYLDDVAVPGTLHVVFVRSPYAHARIVSVDIEAARSMPNVEGVFLASDLAAVCQPMQVVLHALKTHSAAKQFPLAEQEVCWHGQPVAAVVARSRAEAEDAADNVLIEYEELPVVVDLQRALDPDAPNAVSAHQGNLALEKVVEAGDVSSGLEKAAVVARLKLTFDRQTGVPLEPRGILAHFAPSVGELLVYQSHQAPFQMREVYAQLLGIGSHKVRVVCPDVGGAFGIKLSAYPDEIAVAAIAVLLGRSVKFQADRIESFLSDTHAREAVAEASLAVDAEGKFLAFNVSALSGLGAYECYPRGSVGEGLLMLQLIGAPYEYASFHARLCAVYQNKAPTGPYRGVGQPLGCTITESLVDQAARALRVDPTELRRRNYLPASRSTAPTPAGLMIGSLSLTECLDKLLERMKYSELRHEQERLRARGTYRGVGVATFIELTGVGAGLYGGNHVTVGAQEGCTLRLEPSGTFLCHSSATDQGQGARNGVAQIVADVFDVPVHDVLVRSGDTAASPVGGGAWASRGLAIGGEAALLAAKDLRTAVLAIAARILSVPLEQLQLQKGVIQHVGSGRALPLSELAHIAYFRQHTLPAGSYPELSATRHYVTEKVPYLVANGVQACHLEVDIETGLIRVLGFWVVHDCGRVINPLLVDEQIRGGVVQGLGGALYEHCVYSESGQLSNATMADYHVPMAFELPDIDIAHVGKPAQETTLGAKGVGEAGTIGAGAAVWNAVNDALHPLNAGLWEQPFTPERVLRAIARAASSGRTTSAQDSTPQSAASRPRPAKIEPMEAI